MSVPASPGLRSGGGAMPGSSWRAATEKLAQAALQGAAWDQHPVATAEAAHADVRSQAKDLPVVAPARVRLTQSQDVVDAELDRLSGIVAWRRDGGFERGAIHYRIRLIRSRSANA